MLRIEQELLDNFLKLAGNPVCLLDAAHFSGVSHPVVIEHKDSAYCAQCGEAPGCNAALEVYIPQFGRLLYREGYHGDIGALVSFLTGATAVLAEHRAFEAQGDQFELYRQLAKKVMDLNPHAVTAVDADGGVIYQNIAAQSEGWTDGQAQSAVTFPIFRGAKSLGHIAFVKMHPYPDQSVPFSGNAHEMAFDPILGTDPAITNCINIARQVSAANSTTLILGESGTGKEVFARAIHKASLRRSEAFITLNCAAIPENLLESELFGYVEGAFTDAKKGGKVGKIVAAHKGTLFLDEIGDLPLALQAKLLRVLQDKKVEPVGSLKSTAVDVRFICATNQNIEALIAERRFREDLYYRINVIPIHIPPLRTRRQDIAVLLHYNIRKYCVRCDKPFRTIDPALEERLMEYEWRGNVRELENVVEYAITVCDGDCITADHLPVYLKKALAEPANAGSAGLPHPQAGEVPVPGGDDVLTRMLRLHGSDTAAKKRIAQELGISLATLYRRLKQIKSNGGQP